jgi:NDP-sugar pyrophosphorylase family protein
VSHASFVLVSFSLSRQQKKGGLARDEEDIEYIALSYDNNDENNSSSSSSLLQSPRVIWKQSKIDVEQDEDLVGQTPKLVLPKSRLRGQRPSTKVVVATDWMDLHVYVLSPWIIDLLQARNKTTVSLQGDVVPLLVTRQYKGKKATFGSSLEAAAEDSLTSADDSEYAVRAHVLDGRKALRVATIPSYLYACREVVSRVVQGDAKVELPPNTTVNAKFQSILMEGATLGEKVTCKSSTVGRNAKVSSRCRLNNVIVMENVEIGENCVLQNSILGAGCVIGENCNLNDCQVAPGKQVPTGTKEKGESLIDVV